MRALAADLPDGLAAGFRAGLEAGVTSGSAVSHVYAAGMGGSAIAADLVRGIVDAESRVGLTVVRSHELPRSVDAAARVILVSYSGATWETVRAYADAGRRGAHRTVVTSGGPLAERAEEDGVPVVRVPPGMPARSAIGHLLGSVLGLLDPTFPESNESRVQGIAERLRLEIGRYAAPRGPAATIAEAIGTRWPFVYADHGFAALARRWRTQFEENAKRLAVSDELPEMLHNGVVGWDSVRRADAGRCAAMLLEWPGYDPLVRRGFRALDRLLRARGVRVQRVPLPADDRLEALMRGVALGDQVSLRLATIRKVDPSDVGAIDRIRAGLGGVVGD